MGKKLRIDVNEIDGEKVRRYNEYYGSVRGISSCKNEKDIDNHY